MGSLEEIKIENEFILLRFQNDSNEIIKVERPVNQGLIQFHFGLKGKGKFVFTNGEYFTGTFKNDLPEGIVEYHNIYGKVIRGTIRGDQFYPENEPANPSQKLQKMQNFVLRYNAYPFSSW